MTDPENAPKFHGRPITDWFELSKPGDKKPTLAALDSFDVSSPDVRKVVTKFERAVNAAAKTLNDDLTEATDKDGLGVYDALEIARFCILSGSRQLTRAAQDAAKESNARPDDKIQRELAATMNETDVLARLSVERIVATARILESVSVKIANIGTDGKPPDPKDMN